MQDLTQQFHNFIFRNIEQNIIFLLSPLSYKPNTYKFAHGYIFHGPLTHILAY